MADTASDRGPIQPRNLRDYLSPAVEGVSKYGWTVPIVLFAFTLILGFLLAILSGKEDRYVVSVVYLGALYVLVVAIITVFAKLGLRGFRQAIEDLHKVIKTCNEQAETIRSLEASIQAPSPQRFYEVGAEVIGMVRDNIIRASELFHDGHMESVWDMNLRAVSTNVSIIEHRYWADGPLDKVGVFLREQSVDGHTIRLQQIESIRKEKQYVIKIFPDLVVGKSLLIPLRTVSGPGAFKMESEDPDYQETSSVKIHLPTNHLRMTILFPPDFMPDRASYDVWFGDTRVRNDAEFGRIAKTKRSATLSDASGRPYLYLDVEHPVQGLSYALRWWPPLKGERSP